MCHYYSEDKHDTFHTRRVCDTIHSYNMLGIQVYVGQTKQFLKGWIEEKGTT